jgi:hypothetical protein
VSHVVLVSSSFLPVPSPVSEAAPSGVQSVTASFLCVQSVPASFLWPPSYVLLMGLSSTGAAVFSAAAVDALASAGPAAAAAVI